ncbi:amidase [Actinacidiphila sp. ITFR-21]|uniref:amidase n=1 Tax=Actinacidiphila sp. ITFR-21 TaxID=3075199 RepID=UPI002889CBB3|nr:amidase [Streptomyces sp. ITFR-21]WNI18802.1 amidase [Streptomyces sp. ITFR-21]
MTAGPAGEPGAGSGPEPLWHRSAGQLAAAYAEGSATPADVLEAVIERAEQVDERLNVFAHRAFDEARRAAAASGERWRRGTPAGPYDGVPVTVKDNIPVAGMPCAWGSRVFAARTPDRDELCVTRLRAGGWVILGKTNVSEFTLGLGNVDTLLHGTTRNPWDPRLTTGASTGGGAAAVAAGVGPVALGTDGGGSIRWPAAYCGLVGLKPTVGRIARHDGLPVVLHDLEVVAPAARTVADLAALLDAVAGPDPRDRASLGVPDPPGAGGRPLRIRLVGRFGDHPVEPAVTASLTAAADRLTALGHVVTAGPVPFDFARFDRHWRTIGTTGLAWLLRDHDGWRQQVGAIYPPMVEHGRSLTAVDYVAALTTFRELFVQLADFFTGTDLLLTPTAGAMPWPADQLAPPYQRVFTGIANATGVPAITLPGPPSPDGLPVGFQLLARYGADRLLLDVARDYESGFPWADRRPVPHPPKGA